MRIYAQRGRECVYKCAERAREREIENAYKCAERERNSNIDRDN